MAKSKKETIKPHVLEKEKNLSQLNTVSSTTKISKIQSTSKITTSQKNALDQTVINASNLAKTLSSSTQSVTNKKDIIGEKKVQIASKKHRSKANRRARLLKEKNEEIEKTRLLELAQKAIISTKDNSKPNKKSFFSQISWENPARFLSNFFSQNMLTQTSFWSGSAESSDKCFSVPWKNLNTDFQMDVDIPNTTAPIDKQKDLIDAESKQETEPIPEPSIHYDFDSLPKRNQNNTTGTEKQIEHSSTTIAENDSIYQKLGTENASKDSSLEESQENLNTKDNSNENINENDSPSHEKINLQQDDILPSTETIDVPQDKNLPDDKHPTPIQSNINETTNQEVPLDKSLSTKEESKDKLELSLTENHSIQEDEHVKHGAINANEIHNKNQNFIDAEPKLSLKEPVIDNGDIEENNIPVNQIKKNYKFDVNTPQKFLNLETKSDQMLRDTYSPKGSNEQSMESDVPSTFEDHEMDDQADADDIRNVLESSLNNIQQYQLNFAENDTLESDKTETSRGISSSVIRVSGQNASINTIPLALAGRSKSQFQIKDKAQASINNKLELWPTKDMYDLSHNGVLSSIFQRPSDSTLGSSDTSNSKKIKLDDFASFSTCLSALKKKKKRPLSKKISLHGDKEPSLSNANYYYGVGYGVNGIINETHENPEKDLSKKTKSDKEETEKMETSNEGSNFSESSPVSSLQNTENSLLEGDRNKFIRKSTRISRKSGLVSSLGRGTIVSNRVPSLPPLPQNIPRNLGQRMAGIRRETSAEYLSDLHQSQKLLSTGSDIQHTNSNDTEHQSTLGSGYELHRKKPLSKAMHQRKSMGQSLYMDNNLGVGDKISPFSNTLGITKKSRVSSMGVVPEKQISILDSKPETVSKQYPFPQAETRQENGINRDLSLGKKSSFSSLIQANPIPNIKTFVNNDKNGNGNKSGDLQVISESKEMLSSDKQEVITKKPVDMFKSSVIQQIDGDLPVFQFEKSWRNSTAVSVPMTFSFKKVVLSSLLPQDMKNNEVAGSVMMIKDSDLPTFSFS
ncbi:hypothetical protein BB559_006168 [Furculomyces boomerangus]|uniref:Uncharacterized protein n=1 Tax=Furculomyces boomerangus TaxID=61424 RepID=A0A2T9Y4B2_9FUNG|nr:hypothetical protein BB559_006168 [Furculomyces boomerangus]